MVVLAAVFLAGDIDAQPISGRDKVFIASVDVAGLEANGAVEQIRAAAFALSRDYSVELVYLYTHVYFGFAFRTADGRLPPLSSADRVRLRLREPITEAQTNVEPATDSAGSASDWWTSELRSRDATTIEKRLWILDSGVSAPASLIRVSGALSGSFLYAVNGKKVPDIVAPLDKRWGDGRGHGTAVAGIAASMGSVDVISGVARGAMVVAIKVLPDTGQGADADLIAGLDWVGLNYRKGDVVNVSLTSKRNDKINKAIEDLCGQGAIVVIASGNYGRDVSRYSPASVRHENAWVVAALRPDMKLWPRSNLGGRTFWAEPGVDIASVPWTGPGFSRSGTSFAAGMLSAALLFEYETLPIAGSPLKFIRPK